MMRLHDAIFIALLVAPRTSGAAPDLGPASSPSNTTLTGSFRLTLTGDPLTATPLVTERLGVIPFGRWLNAIPAEKNKRGFEFAAQLNNCSSRGCIVGLEDTQRVLIAKRGIADAIRLDIFDAGWKRIEAAAISESGQVAIPVVSPKDRREIWIIRSNGRMRKRIPHAVKGPMMLRWRNGSLFMVYQGPGGFSAMRASLSAGTMQSATPMEAWWVSCKGGPAQPLAVGLTGEIHELLEGVLTLPLYRRGNPQPGWLELTQSTRPMTTQGSTSPVHVKIDCLGRVNIVSALGNEVWCLRFGPDGKILKASKVDVNLAGDHRSIKIDQRGRFYLLEAELDLTQGGEPSQLNLLRLN